MIHIEKKHSTHKNWSGQSFWHKLRRYSTLMLKCVTSQHLYSFNQKKKNLNRNILLLKNVVSDIQLAQQLCPHWTAMLVVTALNLTSSWRKRKEEKEEANLGWFNYSESLRDRFELFQFPSKLRVKGFLRDLEWALVVGVLSCLGRVNKLLNCMRKYVLHLWECPFPWFHPLKHFFSGLLKL